MNEIRVGRLLLAGLATFVAWIIVEILVEQVIGRFVFGPEIQEMWLEASQIGAWTGLNHGVNLFIALLNSTLLIWLYASLRPMYGVGTRTALITSAVGIVWAFSLIANCVNLGLFPSQPGLVEALYLAIEFPIATMAGAEVYEGHRHSRPEEAL
jgi:hypothetical protein